MTKHQLEIVVANSELERLEGVRVTAEPEAGGNVSHAEFDGSRRLYFFRTLRPGFFRLSLEHPAFDAQSRRIQVHPTPTTLRFILSSPETPYTLQGGTRVPYQSRPQLIGVIFSFRREIDREAIREIQELFGHLSLTPEAPLIIGVEREGLGLQETPRLRESVVVRRTRIPEHKNNDLDLAELRNNRWIEAAGPLFRVEADEFTVFTNRVMVRFRPEITRSEIARILDTHKLALTQEMTYAPSLFLASANPTIGEGINQIAQGLMDTGTVEYAEPSLAQVYNVSAITPNDYLWPASWDRQRVNVQAAWERLRQEQGEASQFGSADVIIAVVDRGVKSVGQVPEHSDLNGNVSNGNSKTYRLFNFVRMVDNNEQPVLDDLHGVACAGIALAAANNELGNSDVGMGTIGAAPNARLMGLISPSNQEHIIEMFRWAAGLRFQSQQPDFPSPINPGADIVTCSLNLGKGAPIPDPVRDMLSAITMHGRRGKGCITLFSAGNDATNVEFCGPYGTDMRSSSCAASTINDAGQEVRAKYSCYGEEISWCAPSSSDHPPKFHNPPSVYATWSATFLTKGTVPSLPVFTTILTQNVFKGDTVISVGQTSGLIPNRPILISEPGQLGCEAVEFTGLVSEGRISIKSIGPGGNGLMNAHSAGDEVASGPAHHFHRFGGTSSATPLCAGICALVLSANPELTWIEAKDILRETATKIDLDNEDPIARWVDEDDNPSKTSGKPPVFSRGYGYGRLDADKAVKKALEYTFPRDLMIRKDVNDKGKTPRFSTDSPDIWVRNADPAMDTQAIPKKYRQPGPDQTPSRSSPRWIYARVRNRGTRASLNAWVRFYVASFDGTSFLYPSDWEPKNGLGNRTTDTWDRGTYFIGEVALPTVKAGKHFIVHIPWPDKLLPPDLDPDGRLWNPFLLVEITPHDGPLKGDHIGDNNNLAQKAISILQ
jgi:subtilisin family serine protease